MKSIQSIVIIGAGNVATHMAIAFNAAGLDILGIYSRTFENAKTLADKINVKTFKTIADIPTNADAYLLTVTDAALPELIKKIPSVEGIIMHTSGSVGLSVFSNSIKRKAVFYPLQTFSKAKAVDFSKIPVLIESEDNAVLSALQDLGDKISRTVKVIDSEQRKQLHLAAVFASNFSNFMFHVAHDLMAKNDLDFDLLKPLISETVQKLNSLSPSESQTGPAIRQDLKTLSEHLEILKNHPNYHSIYQLISDQIKNIKT